MLNANFSQIEHFKLTSIVDAIPREWGQIIRESTQHLLPSHIGDTIYLKLEFKALRWLYQRFHPNYFTMLLKVKKTSSSNCSKEVSGEISPT